MKYKMTLRIKPEHTTKEFKEGGGAGVLLEQELIIPDNTDITSNMFIAGLIELEKEFMNKYCEVITEKL